MPFKEIYSLLEGKQHQSMVNPGKKYILRKLKCINLTAETIQTNICSLYMLQRHTQQKCRKAKTEEGIIRSLTLRQLFVASLSPVGV